MTENTAISIICTTYNHEKYIVSCLNGMLSQNTNYNYEIIIHDDASTDNTANIISEYALRYPNIIFPIIQKENLYSKQIDFMSRYILPKVKGKYIAFCEGDDYWIDSNKLQIQIDFLENHAEYSACVHNTLFHHCEKEFKDFPMFIWRENIDLCFKDIIRWNAFGYQTSSLVTRKELLEKTPFFGYGEFPLAVYLVLQGKIYFIAQNMSCYRFRSSSSATRANIFNRSKIIDEYLDIINTLNSIYKYVDDNNKQIVRLSLDRYNKQLVHIRNLSDYDYYKQLRFSEKLANIKYFIRSKFRVIYALLKRLQLSQWF